MSFMVDFDFDENGIAMATKWCDTKEEAEKFVAEEAPDGNIIEIIW